MNLNIVSSLVIVGITAVVGVLQANRLSTVSKERVVLEEEATSLGIVLKGGTSSKSEGRVADGGGTKRSGGGAGTGNGTPSGREGGGSFDPKAEGESFAKELIEFAKRMKEMEKSGEEPSREDKAALFAFLNRFLSLDAEVLPFLMDEIRAYDGLEAEDKSNILMFAMMSMAQSAPEKALDLFLNSGEMLSGGGRSDQVVAMALGGWAAQDPVAALSWLEAHAAELPEKIVPGMRTHAIAQAFAADPDLAVGKALELEREQVLELAGLLARVNQSPEEQLGILRQVQDRLGDLPANPSEMNEEFLETASTDQLLRGVLLVGVGQSLTGQSFASSREFLDSADLSPSESYAVAYGIAENAEGLQDPGEWLPWLHENSPEVQREETVSQVVEGWTRRDFRSTAEWIGEQPQGPLREQATYSFAETVSQSEPQSAAEWALTLPASEERTILLQDIHDDWQARDADAAAAFAREQGLEVE